MKKVIVAVAPVADEDKDAIDNPVHPKDIADEVLASAEAGASLVHLHVRDKKGNLTPDITNFSQTVELIKKHSDIIIQGSTGGLSELSLEERCSALKEDKIEMASLNMGSLNMEEEVYINKFSDIRYWAERMKAVNVKPELEIFEAGMVNNVNILEEEGYIKTPHHFGFCLGVKGALPSDSYHLHYLKQLVPDNSTWGVIHNEMKDFSLLATAVGMGANVVRVGYEDSIYYDSNKIGKSNSILVEKIVKLIKNMGLKIASPEEARDILNIK